MSLFNTIHIFKFGQVQIISDDINKTCDSNSLQSLPQFINELKNHRPSGISDLPYHIIHIFYDNTIRYVSIGSDLESGDEGSFSVSLSEFNKNLLDSLVNELRN